MLNYTETIAEILKNQYPNLRTDSIIINKLNIRLIPLKAQILLEKYVSIKTLVITNCDLRKLENFPILP